MRGGCRIVFVDLENRFDGVSIDGSREATGDPYLDTDIGERRGQGAVPIFSPGKVRLEGHKAPLDGRRLGVQVVAQMAVVCEDFVFRQRVSEVVRIGEAREGAQVLGIGPERVVAEAAFIAARVDEGGVIEMGAC